MSSTYLTPTMTSPSLSCQSSSSTLRVPSPFSSRPSSPALSTTSIAISSCSIDKSGSLDRSRKRTRSAWDLRSLSRSRSPGGGESFLDLGSKKRSFVDLRSHSRSPSPMPTKDTSSPASAAIPTPAVQGIKKRTLSPESLRLPEWLGGESRHPNHKVIRYKAPRNFIHRRVTTREYEGKLAPVFSISWYDEDWKFLRREEAIPHQYEDRSYEESVRTYMEHVPTLKERLQRAPKQAVWEAKDVYRYWKKWLTEEDDD